MKTAMQELLEYVKWHNSGIIITVPNELKEKIGRKIEELLEKEKEQIIKAVEDTRGNIVPKMFIDENLSGEQYYNQTYNQNK